MRTAGAGVEFTADTRGANELSVGKVFLTGCSAPEKGRKETRI